MRATMMRRQLVKAVVVLAVLLVAGCGASTSGTPGAVSTAGSAQQPSAPQAAPSAPAQVGTGGELVAIQSDNVQAAGYDAALETMTVLFDSGGLYEYYDVPPSLWEAFVAAQPHPWSSVGHPRLVQAGVRYQRIG